MDQSWQFNGFQFTAAIPANIETYTAVLGVDDAVELFLKLGGSEIYLPQNSTHVDALLAGVVGQERACQLGKSFDQNIVRVPVARSFLCRHLKGQGRSIAEIARTVRLSNVAVRGHINGSVRANAPTPVKTLVNADHSADQPEAS